MEVFTWYFANYFFLYGTFYIRFLVGKFQYRNENAPISLSSRKKIFEAIRATINLIKCKLKDFWLPKNAFYHFLLHNSMLLDDLITVNVTLNLNTKMMQ